MHVEYKPFPLRGTGLAGPKKEKANLSIYLIDGARQLIQNLDQGTWLLVNRVKAELSDCNVKEHGNKAPIKIEIIKMP